MHYHESNRDINGTFNKTTTTPSGCFCNNLEEEIKDFREFFVNMTYKNKITCYASCAQPTAPLAIYETVHQTSRFAKRLNFVHDYFDDREV